MRIRNENEIIPHKKVPTHVHYANERRAEEGTHATGEEVEDQRSGSYKKGDNGV